MTARWDWNFAGADAYFRRAIAANPSPRTMNALRTAMRLSSVLSGAAQAKLEQFVAVTQKLKPNV